jgi:hypothetical protein
VSFGRRDVGEVEALITDRYLDSLLALHPADGGTAEDPSRSVGAAVRAVSRRLATDLPRFHPSFRFEERLALRLAEVAATMRLPAAASGEGGAVEIRQIQPVFADPLRVPVAVPDDDRDPRPLLIGGAVAASALSLAGAWIAWRRRTSPMARAVRAAHHLRHIGGV